MKTGEVPKSDGEWTSRSEFLIATSVAFLTKQTQIIFQYT